MSTHFCLQNKKSGSAFIDYSAFSPQRRTSIDTHVAILYYLRGIFSIIFLLLPRFLLICKLSCCVSCNFLLSIRITSQFPIRYFHFYTMPFYARTIRFICSSVNGSIVVALNPSRYGGTALSLRMDHTPCPGLLKMC